MRDRRTRLGGVSWSLVLGVVASALFAPPALATNYTVLDTADPTPGGCMPNNDCLSLRDAVYAANANPGLDTIVLEPNLTYTLTQPASGAAASLEVTDGLKIVTILGTGSAIINGNGTVTGNRVFAVEGSNTLSLLGVEVANGVAPANQNGGGIKVNAGAGLSMFEGKVVGNSVATGGNSGGGIWNNGGTVNLDATAVTSNYAIVNGVGGVGGGIFTDNNGVTNITDSRLFDNHATGGAALGTINSNASVTVLNSQLSFNVANEDGGAVYNGLQSYAHYDFVNTTINDNTAGQLAGAIRVRDAFVTLKNSTITGNSAADGGGIVAQDTGGPATTYVTMANTILAGNTDSDNTAPAAPDCYDQTGGLVHSSGYNIVGDTTGCTNDLTVFPATGDQLGSNLAPVNPKLRTENFNGGDFAGVETFQPKPGSPAINAGNPAKSGGCEATDARYVPRRLGRRCDVGAYELVKCGGVVVNRVAAPDATIGGGGELSPTSGNDGFLGLGRDDFLFGGDGNDGMCGGAGADILSGESGNDHLLGGPDEDVLKGGPGNDVLKGGKGNDHLNGGPGRDVCVGGPGTDTAKGCEVKRSIP